MRTYTTPLVAALLAAGLLLPAATRASDAHAPAKPAKAAAKPAAKPGHADEAPTVASATPAPPADPLDQLRVRLAERLSGGAKPAEAANPHELRVVAKAPPPAAASHGPAKGGASRAAAKTADGHGAAHWAYNGATGPAAWGGLKPEFGLCSSGSRQSPIDIRGGLAVDLEPVRFEYQPSRFGVIDNGHTVQVNVAAGNSIDIGGQRFELVQFHFHRPSEERIDGRQFEMSLHLVHKDDQGRLAVVALVFDKGPAQPVVQKVWNNLPLEKNEEAPARSPLELAELLPADRRYYTYMGSLTTPPCSEGVKWIVMRQPVTLAPEQIELFSRIYPMNSRPLQAASGRRIIQSN